MRATIDMELSDQEFVRIIPEHVAVICGEHGMTQYQVQGRTDWIIMRDTSYNEILIPTKNPELADYKLRMIEAIKEMAQLFDLTFMDIWNRLAVMD